MSFARPTGPVKQPHGFKSWVRKHRIQPGIHSNTPFAGDALRLLFVQIAYPNQATPGVGRRLTQLLDDVPTEVKPDDSDGNRFIRRC